MLSLVTLALLSGAPEHQMVVVVPVTVMGEQPKHHMMGRALQSVFEADLRANGLPVRTEDDLDSANWGKIAGASHILVVTLLSIGQRYGLSMRLVQGVINVGSAKAMGFGERAPLVKAVFHTLKRAVPADVRLLTIAEELLVAWGEALAALHDGSPADAKAKVADVAKKWPAFTPAIERLEQLSK